MEPEELRGDWASRLQGEPGSDSMQANEPPYSPSPWPVAHCNWRLAGWVRRAVGIPDPVRRQGHSGERCPAPIGEHSLAQIEGRCPACLVGDSRRIQDCQVGTLGAIQEETLEAFQGEGLGRIADWVRIQADCLGPVLDIR